MKFCPQYESNKIKNCYIPKKKTNHAFVKIYLESEINLKIKKNWHESNMTNPDFRTFRLKSKKKISTFNMLMQTNFESLKEKEPRNNSKNFSILKLLITLVIKLDKIEKNQ